MLPPPLFGMMAEGKLETPRGFSLLPTRRRCFMGAQICSAGGGRRGSLRWGQKKPENVYVRAGRYASLPLLCYQKDGWGGGHCCCRDWALFVTVYNVHRHGRVSHSPPLNPQRIWVCVHAGHPPGQGEARRVTSVAVGVATCVRTYVPLPSFLPLCSIALARRGSPPSPCRL